MTVFTLWGASASPYQLKMQSLLDYADIPWRRWPENASRTRALVTVLRLRRARRAGAVQRYGGMDPALDEYPSVPFYTEDGRTFFYDSTSLADHLDAHPACTAPPLLPGDPALAFVARLLDEAFDEFGLYMVHHMRWVGSARTTTMGDFTAAEFRPLLPPGLSRLVAQRLYRRQVRRCPYLFSVAPPGYEAGVAAERTPPAREGFPPTHDLLFESWRRYLAAMETVLAVQPYLLGQQFTLADASAYGQLGMNLVDPEAADLLRDTAPRTWDWLRAIHRGEHAGSDGSLELDEALVPLLEAIGETFVPLMEQNETAFEQAVTRGETLFNEAAFDAGRALYDGELVGHPFRAVVKTFQVRVWRDLKAAWAGLDAVARGELEAVLPAGTVAALS